MKAQSFFLLSKFKNCFLIYYTLLNIETLKQTLLIENCSSLSSSSSANIHINLHISSHQFDINLFKFFFYHAFTCCALKVCTKISTFLISISNLLNVCKMSLQANFFFFNWTKIFLVSYYKRLISF